jgi:hypothetical protein
MHRSDEAERQQPVHPWLAMCLPLEPLETWRDRVLDAATLTEVLGHPGH